MTKKLDHTALQSIAKKVGEGVRSQALAREYGVTVGMVYRCTQLMICVDRKCNSTDVLDALTDLFILRGPPEYIRSDNGPEFIAQKVRSWITAVGAKAAYIVPGSLWENGYCESFNARFRDELLNGELLHSLREAQILIE